VSQEVPVQTQLACSQCGRAFAQSDLVQIAARLVCADCKPAFLSRVMASGAAGAFAREYGGFWIRFGARMIDGIIFAVPILAIAALVIPSLLRSVSQGSNSPNVFPGVAGFGVMGFFLLSFVAAGCYEVLMLKHRGATLGKMACGLKVIRSDGQNLGWGVCFGRFFMWNIVTSGIPYVNMVLMPISLIMLGVDGEKRAMHDRVCDTRVVCK
jgi:uncharacterized RDD family membrane protein YckC